MFSKLFNIDKLRTGYIFDNSNELFYDADTLTTKNIFTGKGIKGCDLVWETTPTFRTDFGTENRQSIRLDNTIRGEFINAIPDGGCVLVVGKFTYGTIGTRNYSLLMGGDGTNPLTMTALNLQFFSGATRLRFLPVSGGWYSNIEGVNETYHIAGLSIDGENSRSNTILNDGTVQERINTSPSTVNNNVFSPSTNRNFRIGYLNTDVSDDSAILDSYDIASIFFFGGNPLLDQPTEMAELIEQINDYYGVY